jgi:hypothetical protein
MDYEDTSENSISGLIHIKYLEKLKGKKPNRICYLLDGGANSKKAFDIAVKEFLPRLKNRELIGCHIYDSINDSSFNWQFKKNYILDQYLFSFDRIIKYPNLFYLQDKKYHHNIVQAYNIAFNLSAKYFIFNFYSLKEQNLLLNNIFKGLDYLLIESKIPTIIMKDELMRCDKEKGVSNNKGYTWLILFDGTNTKSFNVLEYFWPLIDRQKDFIYVLTLVNNFFYSDQIKDKFIKKMDQYNLRENINYYYYFDCVPGQKQFKYLKEFINFNEDYYFDFVLFYNNPLRYKVKRNDSYQLIIQLKANIGFINLENLDNFFPEEIIDYKEIEKIDKEERRKRRMLEHAEQTLSIDRAYRELQNILLSDYHEKKLERQDTDTSLVHNNNEENNINNDINKSDNKENEEDFFIFGNKLKLLPKIKTKENKRYGENKKEGERMKVTETNFNKNKIKNRSASKIYIKAKNIQNLNVMTSGKINYNNGERNDIKSISNRLKNIRPMNLKEKLTINAKNKFKY